MGTSRLVLLIAGVVLCVCGRVLAQLEPLEVRLFQDRLVSRYVDAKAPEGALPPLRRLCTILQEAWAGDGKQRPLSLMVVDDKGALVCMARGPQQKIAAVQAAFDELAKDPPVHVKLQCSLVTLPALVAQEHGLKPNLVKATDETAFGKLVRDAMQHKGTLCNLPEATVAPLAPFHLQPAGNPAAKDDQVLRVRGEMVPVSATEVVVGMQLVRGPLPADQTHLPKASLLQSCIRLAPGGAVMVMVVEGGDAAVLIVRCVSAAHEVPPPTKEK